METQVPTIRRLMKNILGCCDDDTMLKVPGPEISPGLRALLSFGIEIESDDQAPLGKAQFELLISNRPPYSIIESLIEAAVCTWVFESDFPNFEQEPGDLSLFTKYREIIAAQGKFDIIAAFAIFAASFLTSPCSRRCSFIAQPGACVPSCLDQYPKIP